MISISPTVASNPTWFDMLLSITSNWLVSATSIVIKLLIQICINEVSRGPFLFFWLILLLVCCFFKYKTIGSWIFSFKITVKRQFFKGLCNGDLNKSYTVLKFILLRPASKWLLIYAKSQGYKQGIKLRPKIRGQNLQKLIF